MINWRLIADADKADCDMLPKVQYDAAYPTNYDDIHSIVTSLRDALHFSIFLTVPFNSISDMNEYPAWLNNELKVISQWKLFRWYERRALSTDYVLYSIEVCTLNTLWCLYP